MAKIKLNPDLSIADQLGALLDADKFLAWLQRPGTAAIVGKAGVMWDCPIQHYLVAKAGDAPRVEESKVEFDGNWYCGPLWMEAFVRIVDRKYWNQKVTKQQAQAVLAEALEVVAEYEVHVDEYGWPTGPTIYERVTGRYPA
jgi:hypothetical protein